jgi:hypothetical protein
LLRLRLTSIMLILKPYSGTFSSLEDSGLRFRPLERLHRGQPDEGGSLADGHQDNGGGRREQRKLILLSLEYLFSLPQRDQ